MAFGRHRNIQGPEAECGERTCGRIGRQVTMLLTLLLLQDPEALSARALELAQARQPAEAEKIWKQALTLQPNLFSAAFNLGYLYYSQRQHDAAEPLLARAACVQPKDFNAHYLLGVVRSQLGRTDDALRA